MTLRRIMHLYGNEPPLYYFSACLLSFGIGYNVANFINWADFIGNIIILFIAVQFMDAIAKGIRKFKEIFKVSVTIKER